MLENNNNKKRFDAQEFFEYASILFEEENATPAVAKKWWYVFVEIIVRWCFLRGECRLPQVGVFKMIKSPREVVPVRFKNNTDTPVYQSNEKFLVYFEPVDDFIDDVNMKGISHEFRKKARKGLLTTRDYLRELRAEQLTKVKKWDKAREKHSKATQKEFLAELKEKQKDWAKPKGNKYRK